MRNKKWPDWTNQISTCLQLFKCEFLDNKLIAVADSQSNKTNFIGVLFCYIDEAHTHRVKNEKVAAFYTLARKYRCLMT